MESAAMADSLRMVCYIGATLARVKTISQRELRNDSGEIMRGLTRGESYRVTSRGNQVGVLLPAKLNPAVGSCHVAGQFELQP